MRFNDFSDVFDLFLNLLALVQDLALDIVKIFLFLGKLFNQILPTDVVDMSLRRLHHVHEMLDHVILWLANPRWLFYFFHHY